MPRKAKTVKRTRARATDKPPKRVPGASLTGDIRECIENAFHAAGGRNYLVWVAQRRPDVFLALVGKIIPSEARLTVLAGYQAMPVPVEAREPIPGLIAAPEPSPAVLAGPSQDPIGPAVIPLDDWLAL